MHWKVCVETLWFTVNVAPPPTLHRWYFQVQLSCFIFPAWARALPSTSAHFIKQTMGPKLWTTNMYFCKMFAISLVHVTRKGLTPKLWAKPSMIYHILWLSVEFSWFLGSPTPMALSCTVVPRYQTLNVIEIFLISTLETPSPRIRKVTKPLWELSCYVPKW